MKIFLVVAALVGLVASICAPAASYADTCGSHTDHAFTVGTGLYGFTYDAGQHGTTAEALPPHYTGSSMSFGFHPTSCLSFELGYFSNGHDAALKGGLLGSVTKSHVQFHVWTLRTLLDLFAVPYTHRTMFVTGAVSINRIDYTGSIDTALPMPGGKSHNVQLLGMSGKGYGPSASVGIVYRPYGSTFEGGVRYTVYSFHDGTTPASNLITVFFQRRF